jgi:hypothetical protein
MLPANTVLYASDDSAEAIAEAREYARRYGLTADDCKIVKKDGQCLVIAKRALKLQS